MKRQLTINLKRSLICMSVWLLSGCNTQPIESTPAIEPTLRATPTVESQPSDRVTATSASTATVAPSHLTTTPQPTITSVPTPSTVSSSDIPPAAILLFEVIPERANPGGTVQLRWQAQGERATLCPSSRFVLFTLDDCRDVPLSGTQAFVIPSDVRGNKYIDFLLTVSGTSAAPVTQQTHVALQCQQTWFFTDEPQFGVCPLEPIRTQAAAQHFERGLMIWLKDPGRYFILENRHVGPGDIRRPLNTIADPLDVVRDTANSVTPPAGFFAPSSGFCLIWRGDVQQSSGFRDQLGWALEPEFGYEATYQCDDATPSGGRVWQTCYLNDPDGRIIGLLSTGSWYWRDEQSIQGGPMILTFTANRTEARPGDRITLAWTSIGGANASLIEPICCTLNSSTPTINLPPNGSLSFVLANGVVRDTFTYLLSVSNDVTSDYKSIRIRLPCPDRYFFVSTRDDLECPASPPVSSSAAEQRFEQGRMIWLESQRRIYVLFDDGLPNVPGAPPDEFLFFDDTWRPDEPESDPSLVPPAGLYQPVRGFGKVWRSSTIVRESLGWAIAPEQAFEGVWQRAWKTCLLQHSDGSFTSCSGPTNDFQYLPAADGRLIRLAGFSALGRHSVQQWEFWTP